MVTKINKKGFIDELSIKLSYPKDRCAIINDVLESNFFISKKNKDKIIEELMQKLVIDEEEATNIYDTAVLIIRDEVKSKLRHPFKSED